MIKNLTRYSVIISISGVIAVMLYVFYYGLLVQQQSKVNTNVILPSMLIADINKLKKTDFPGNTLKLYHIWSSACSICQQEYEVLTAIKKNYPIAITALHYHEQPEEFKQWQQNNKDIFVEHLQLSANQAIELGIYQIPQTWLVDKNGKLLFTQVGPLTMYTWQQKIWPLYQDNQ